MTTTPLVAQDSSSQQIAASKPRLPESMKRALADSLSLDGTDVPWKMATERPPLADIRAGVDLLEAQLQPASLKVAGFCFKKLLAVLEPHTKMNKEEGKQRFEDWFIAVKDIPDDLWPGATLACMQTLKWFPKPVEFRSHVEATLRERIKLRNRARTMLDTATAKPKPKPFEAEPDDVRIRGARDSFLKIGNPFRAAPYERQLAAMEDRPVEDWAIAPPTPEVEAKSVEVKIPPVGPVQQAALNRSLARTWRKQGFPIRADELEAEADRLDPPRERTVAPAPEIRGNDHGHLA